MTVAKYLGNAAPVDAGDITLAAECMADDIMHDPDSMKNLLNDDEFDVSDILSSAIDFIHAARIYGHQSTAALKAAAELSWQFENQAIEHFKRDLEI